MRSDVSSDSSTPGATSALRLPKPAQLLEFTGERFSPIAQGEIEHEHYHRYLFARQFCHDKKVLDIACGEGYGCALLATVAREVTGVDVSAEVVGHAVRSYSAPNTFFRVGDCVAIPLKQASVDVVISFETLEHIAGHEAFLAEIRRVLRPGGALVLSSPDREVYRPPGAPPNPHHVKELDKQEFAALLAKFFPHVRLFGQASWIGSLILPDAQTSPEACGQPEIFRRRPDDTVAPTTGFRDATYLIAVASDSPVPAVAAGGFEDRPFLLRLYAEHQHRHEEILQREADIKTLLRQAEARDADCAELGSRLQQARSELAALEDQFTRDRQRLDAELARRAEAIDHLEADLHAREIDAGHLLAEMIARRERVAQLESAVLSRAEETTSLRTELRGLRNELHARNQTIADMASSSSWRLTAPARSVSRLVRSALAAFSALVWQTSRAVGRQLGDRVRRMRRARLLARSGLFDAAYYLSHSPDVAASGVESRAPLPPKAPAQDIQRPAVVNAVTESPAHPPYVSHADPEAILRALVVSTPDPLLIAHEVAALSYRPTISILVPVFDTVPQYLQRMVDSVLAQSYPYWQLCLCDDGSSKSETLAAFDALAGKDARIQQRRLSRNRGISTATNAALDMAQGEYIAMLDHDDELTPDALFEIVKVLDGDRRLDAVYSDQDYVEADGTLSRTFFKPDWSLELFRGAMYVGHLLVVRRSLATDVGGFDPAFDNVQDFEFMLRIAERTSCVAHVPKILYHWRMIPGSVALHGNAKANIGLLQAAAVGAHLERCGVPAAAQPNEKFAHRAIIVPKPRTNFPLVSIVVRAADVGPAHTEACLASLLAHDSRSRREVVVVGGQVSAAKRRRLEGAGVRLTITAAQRGVSTTRTGLTNAAGEYLVAMSAGLEVVSADWLEHLLLYGERPEIGCVAPIVATTVGRVHDAGVVLGMDGAVGYPMRGWPVESDGYAGSLSCAREVAAVSGECFMISRRLFEQLGGPNPQFTDDGYQTMDLSLRAAAAGRRNVCTPRAIVRRRPSEAAELKTLDQLLFTDAWESAIAGGDRFHNPNFKQSSPGYQ